MNVLNNILEVNNLSTVFQTPKGQIPAVEGVQFQLGRGEVLGIIGESGSGKSVTSLTIMGLLNRKKTKIFPESEINFEGTNLLRLSEDEMRKIRGREIAMIFQDPLTSLNPVFTIGEQIRETIRLHRNMNKKEIEQEIINILKLVGISSPEQRIHQYPHQLSGGMRQRIMIAMVLSCHPKVLIADEPTTALDVTIQAQILDLLKKLKKELNLSIMLITHDMGVIADMADRVIVMYSGKIVESGLVGDIFKKPLHPYTEGLLKSIPHLEHEEERLNTIGGAIPSPDKKPPGCQFHPRCPYAMERCSLEVPPLERLNPQREVSCWLHIGQSAGKHNQEV